MDTLNVTVLLINGEIAVDVTVSLDAMSDLAGKLSMCNLLYTSTLSLCNLLYTSTLSLCNYYTTAHCHYVTDCTYCTSAAVSR